MKTVGLSIPYANICRDYNTAYLDRDNTDPQTKSCMKRVAAYVETFLNELSEALRYRLYRLNDGARVDVKEVASNRFLFYSLEKAITIQAFVLCDRPQPFLHVCRWQKEAKKGILIQNDEEGEALYAYAFEGTQEARILHERLAAIDPEPAPPLC